MLDDLQQAKGYGITATTSLDWNVLASNREEHISKINKGYFDYFKAEGIDCIIGYASFVDNHTVEVNNIKYHSEHIVIATGSRNFVPSSIEGNELIGTSDDFFKLRTTPKKVLILGNGYIAAELAGLLHSFGVDTTIAIRVDKFLRVFDDDLGDVLKAAMEKSGVQFLTRTEAKCVTKDEEGRLHVTFTTGASDAFDHVFSAIGRAGNIANLKLENTSIYYDRKTDFIPSDEHENTNVSGIYAIGDVSGKVQLTPVAIAAGSKLVHRIFGGKKDSRLDYNCIPTVMFSHPPIGTIGLRERDARAKYPDVKIYKTQFTSMFYTLSEDHQQPTFLKLVCAGPKEQVVGLHACGRGVDEMIQGFGIIHIHITFIYIYIYICVCVFIHMYIFHLVSNYMLICMYSGGNEDGCYEV